MSSTVISKSVEGTSMTSSNGGETSQLKTSAPIDNSQPTVEANQKLLLKSFSLISQAIAKAQSAGVYTLDDSYVIKISLDSMKSILKLDDVEPNSS